ncbi:MAG: Ppx/GppA phosphatase family protein [Pseudomonadota bacterium]
MTYKRRRIASIDLGSNSFLLLAAERGEDGLFTVLADESETPRISEGLRATRTISPEAVQRAVAALTKLSTRAKEIGATEIFATATAAVREASNRDDVIRVFSEAAGVPLEVLPPAEEARLSYLSVTMELPHNERTMVVDIGGGSTEITWGIGHRFDGARSLNLGTVKLLEKHLTMECPTAIELDAARDEIDAALARITPLGTLDHYYGTAGSFTHLASLELGLERYSSQGVAGHILTRERVEEWVNKIASTPFEGRKLLPGADPRRIDVLLSGTLIVERLFEKFKNRSFQVFDRGVRFGKAYDVLRGFAPPIHFA